MKPRKLKIEAAGDFWRGKVTPKIRLAGRWLERAGFKPGCRVEVQISQPGILTLRFLAQSGSAMMDPVPETRGERADILQAPAPAAAYPWQGVLELGRTNYRDKAKSPAEAK